MRSLVWALCFAIFGLRSFVWDLGIFGFGILGWESRAPEAGGGPRAAAGGTRPGHRQLQLFKKLNSEPTHPSTAPYPPPTHPFLAYTYPQPAHPPYPPLLAYTSFPAGVHKPREGGVGSGGWVGAQYKPRRGGYGWVGATSGWVGSLAGQFQGNPALPRTVAVC